MRRYIFSELIILRFAEHAALLEDTDFLKHFEIAVNGGPVTPGLLLLLETAQNTLNGKRRLDVFAQDADDQLPRAGRLVTSAFDFLENHDWIQNTPWTVDSECGLSP
jgi:hypothetical protein